MKIKSINFIFVCTMLLILSACTKESTTLETPQNTQTATPISTKNDRALEIKEYYPPEEVDVTEKVLGFLNHTKTHNPEASFKTEFKDMEVNEAMWTLEAASNFLVNKNFKYEYDSERIEIDVDFQTVVKNRTHIIEGDILTSIFDELMDEIYRKTNSKRKLPKLVDFKLQRKKEGYYFKVLASLVGNTLIDECWRLDRCNDVVSEYGAEECDDNGITHPVWNWGNACETGHTNHFRISCNNTPTSFPYDKLGHDGFLYYEGMNEILRSIHNQLAIEMNDALIQVDDFLWFHQVEDVYDTAAGVDHCTQKAYTGFEEVEFNQITGVDFTKVYTDMAVKTINLANEDICNASNVDNRPRMALEIVYTTQAENTGISDESVCIQYVTMAEAVLHQP